MHHKSPTFRFSDRRSFNSKGLWQPPFKNAKCFSDFLFQIRNPSSKWTEVGLADLWGLSQASRFCDSATLNTATKLHSETSSTPEYLLWHAGKRRFLLNYLFFLVAHGQQGTSSVISPATSHFSLPGERWAMDRRAESPQYFRSNQAEWIGKRNF